MGRIINENKLFVILRKIPQDKFDNVIQAVYDGGIRLFEVTFDPADPDTEKKTRSYIEKIYERFGDKVEVAAGTVIKPEYVKSAAASGATCIVAPNTDQITGELAHENGMLWCPGAYTPTEIVSAYNMGADVVKIFPVLPDGIPYLKTILPPLAGIPFMPTGGVNPETMDTLMQLGASLLGTGVSIIKRPELEKGDFKAIEEAARLHVKIMEKYL